MALNDTTPSTSLHHLLLHEDALLSVGRSRLRFSALKEEVLNHYSDQQPSARL